MIKWQMIMITSIELKRQLFHIVFGLALVALLHYNLINAYILLALAAVGLVISYFSKHHHIPYISWFLHHCERAEDMKTFPGRGVIYYLLGCLLALVFFEKDTALAGMMILALGDSVSHIVGRFYGGVKHPLNGKKLLEGWIAGILAGFLGALLFVHWGEALLASFIAMTVETIEW
ncbi:hypothetical protein HY488_01005, partial [Candidatus Woesearchaeota archaeon]|nr:hypothetical protein [Candidatus Woesearchaeota archaeon]